MAIPNFTVGQTIVGRFGDASNAHGDAESPDWEPIKAHQVTYVQPGPHGDIVAFGDIEFFTTSDYEFRNGTHTFMVENIIFEWR